MASVKIKLHFCMRLLKRYACEKYIFAGGYVKGTHAKNEPIFACGLLKVPHTKIDYLHRCFFSSLFPLRHIKIFTSPLNLLLSPLSLFLSLPLLSSSGRTAGRRPASGSDRLRRLDDLLLHRLPLMRIWPPLGAMSADPGWRGGSSMIDGGRHGGGRRPSQVAGGRRSSSTSSIVGQVHCPGEWLALPAQRPRAAPTPTRRQAEPTSERRGGWRDAQWLARGMAAPPRPSCTDLVAAPPQVRGSGSSTADRAWATVEVR